MTCKICGSGCVSDLTNGYGSLRNYYCHTCHAHLFRDKWYSKSEWEIWIEKFENNS